MALFDSSLSDVKQLKSVFNFRGGKQFTATFGTLYPVAHKFVLPGDVWNVNTIEFIRTAPMLSPVLTPMKCRFRWFFVSLHQLYPEYTDLIITGSSDGKLSEEALPVYKNIFEAFAEANNFSETDIVHTYIFVTELSFVHLMFNIPCGFYNLEDVINLDSAPTEYWLRAYLRVYWDYYRDENLSDISEYTFDEWCSLVLKDLFSYTNSRPSGSIDKVSKAGFRALPVLLPKDYFSGALPWVMKGVQPTINFNVFDGRVVFNNLSNSSVSNIFSGSSIGSQSLSNVNTGGITAYGPENRYLAWSEDSQIPVNNVTSSVKLDELQNVLNNNNRLEATLLNAGLTVSDLRDLIAESRIFERLARTGSRYNEYLHANFGTAPRDETLQRSIYLGGFSQDILTTEVVQTGGDEADNPIGTLRGHGVTFGSNSLRNKFFNEFGVLLGLADFRPEITYNQGVNREFTYKSRWDFFNPSLQNLSEQEVRQGEIYFSPSDSAIENDETFGFQGMFNELRTDRFVACGEFGTNGALEYWTQAIDFSSAPKLNNAFLNSQNYLSSWLRPFGMADVNENPLRCSFTFEYTPYRPMVKNPVPML